MAAVAQAIPLSPSALRLSQAAVPPLGSTRHSLDHVIRLEFITEYNGRYREPLDKAASLAERAKKWQDLPIDKPLYVFKCIAVAVVTAAVALLQIFHVHFLFQLGMGSLLLFLETYLPSYEVFSQVPDWDQLDKSRNELFQAYNQRINFLIDSLTQTANFWERYNLETSTTNSIQIRKPKELKTALEDLKNLWNWVRA